MNEEVWEKLQEEGKLPKDLQRNYEVDFEPSMVSRGRLADQTHLVERGPEDEEDLQGNQQDDDDEMDDLATSALLTDLRTLHDKNLLVGDNISLKDVPVIKDNNLHVLPHNLNMHVNTPVPTPAPVAIDQSTAPDI